MPKYVFNPFTAKLDIQASTKSDVGLSNVDNVQQIPLSYLDTDGTLSANSDTKVASQKATKTYADQLIGAANALVYKGTIDCSANPNYPAADAGHMYIVSVAGKIGGASGVNVEVGDMIICNTDGTPSGDQATVGANFNIIEKNIEGAVSGPASAVTNNVATFDGVTGKIIKDSGVALGTLASQNGTFSGGGTLATGGYTLTVPATGTAALLGTANTFTAAQEINGNLTVDTNTLFVDAANNRVGIGTTSPGERLVVSGSGTQRLFITETSGSVTMAIKSASTGGFFGTVSNHEFFMQQNNVNRMVLDTDGDFYFANIAASRTNARLFIDDSSGNVGIGTTSPIFQLESVFSSAFTNIVSSSMRLVHKSTGNMTNGFGSGFVFGIDDNANSIKNMARIAGVRDGADNTGKLVFDVATTGTLDTKMTILNNGNVGIGTTSPSELLELSKSTSYQLRLTNLGAGAGYWNIGQTSNGFAAGGGKLLFVPDSTSSNAATVTFTNTGKVGIGTTTPQGALHVKDGDGYAMYKYVSPINSATPIVIIPNGTGDVTKIVYFQIVATDQTNSSSSSGSRAPGGAVADIVLGTNIFRLTVNVNGSVDVRRQVGTGTISAMIYLQWI